MADSDAAEAGRLSFAFDLDALSPQLGVVRRWVGEVLADLDEDDRDDCVLVVNELVSNAFDHAVGPRRVRLHWSTGQCFVRVEVDDASPDGLVVGRSRLGGSRGRGLIIVERLSKDWGVDARVTGKTVWAEISCSSATAVRDGR
ncbi:anti-sigma regulatory factor (Ser/Thr protein kinase) [Saccharothrix tamanrassetensis]|uniref:Anti-sigma regulatory factor (Ser/Thr protein kinase) n=1 Tax=Saccharothrix tamanrassetensis TaxID=1051531 RepID=A0A841CJP7_9PSEU|nr:ATP-binding protein [Saccharothrix tamanrassetensis]MBB5957290.1 anti-sigma regulatory factor (Ser/Thr protein kinase) [Saccharothrix tamanrassetensis]